MPQDQDICLHLQVPEAATVLWPFDFPVFIKFTLMCIFSCTHSLIGFNAFCSSSFCFVLGLRFVPEARLEVAGMAAILSIHCQERFSSNSLSPSHAWSFSHSLIHPTALLMVSIVSPSTLCGNGTGEECILRKAPEKPRDSLGI